MPAPDGCDDFIGISLPDERAWFLIVLPDEAVDGGLKVDDRVEDAIFQAASGQLGEEALDGIEPRAGCRHEMEGPARMPGQPGTDFRLFVGRIVVEDDMDGLVGGHLGFDGVEEPNKLLMPVTLHVAADHRAVEDVERGEQGGGAIALVVVRHGRLAPALQRQPWLHAIQRLDLALFVDRQHDGMIRRRTGSVAPAPAANDCR